MRRMVAITFVCMIGLAAVAPSQPANSEVDRERTEWIANAIRSIGEVKVGMTRAELMKVFTTEGGLSAPSQRTYVYRQCPYIKVDVKFSVANPEEELPSDTILEISQPYLQFSIKD